MKVAMRPVRTIGQILPSHKDPLNPEEKKLRSLPSAVF